MNDYEYRRNLVALRSLKEDADEVLRKIEKITAKLQSELLSPQHPLLEEMRSDVNYFQEYVTTTLDLKIEAEIDACPPEYLRDKYEELYYDLTVCKPSSFYTQVETFLRMCRQLLESEFTFLLQYMRANKVGLHMEMPNLMVRKIKLKGQLQHLKQLQEQFDAAEIRDLPDVEDLIEVILVTHRNLKAFRFRMTYTVPKTRLEGYLGRELMAKSQFQTVAVAPILGVDEQGKETGWKARMLSPSALLPKKIIRRPVKALPRTPPKPPAQPPPKRAHGPIFYPTKPVPPPRSPPPKPHAQPRPKRPHGPLFDPGKPLPPLLPLSSQPKPPAQPRAKKAHGPLFKRRV